MGNVQLPEVSVQFTRAMWCKVIDDCSLFSFYYRQPPVGQLPRCPRPGHEIPTYEEGAPSVQDRHSAKYMGHTFASLCEFWQILQPAIEIYVLGDQRRSLSERLPANAAERIYQQLLCFADTHLTLANGDGSQRRPHHNLVLQ